MAELKILGARRVEALSSVLEEKQKEEIAAKNLPTQTDIEAIVDVEFGIAELRAKQRSLKEQLAEVDKSIEAVVGEGRSYRSPSDYRKRVNALYEEKTTAVINEVKRKYKAKEQQLWLCETLEQAKAIVGLT